MIRGMENTPEEKPERLQDECPGAPRYYSYPAPIPSTPEEQRRDDEINARIVARLKSLTGRRSGWRGVD